MSNFTIRPFRKEDYPAVASLLNLIWSMPITAEQLQVDEESIPPGQLHYNEDGQLMGWDRPKWVAENEQGEVIGYTIIWRAPWSEPGNLYLTLIVRPEERRYGVGRALYDEVRSWAQEVKATLLVSSLKEDDETSLRFAQRRGYDKERHTFESVLNLSSFSNEDLFQCIGTAEQSGIRFVTLADEPGEENERKLYDLYRITHQDIPGYSEDFPWFEEWRKWNLDLAGIRPEYIHIAKEGERYIGVVTLQQNEQSDAIYHHYTGVLPEYRGKRIGLALKLLGIQSARAAGANFLRTHNDSMNAPMLHINRDLLGFIAVPGDYKMVCTV